MIVNMALTCAAFFLDGWMPRSNGPTRFRIWVHPAHQSRCLIYHQQMKGARQLCARNITRFIMGHGREKVPTYLGPAGTGIGTSWYTGRSLQMTDRHDLQQTGAIHAYYSSEVPVPGNV